MKRLLIVRSVSFQQLDLNLPEIKKKFPEHEICLLTHPHGVELAKKYNDIDRVFTYDYKGPFQSRNKVADINGMDFDVVIVPVTNMSGSSFENVLQYGVSVKAQNYYMCNMLSEFTKLTKYGILFKRIKHTIFRGMAAVLTVPCLIIYGVLWFCNLHILHKR